VHKCFNWRFWLGSIVHLDSLFASSTLFTTALTVLNFMFTTKEHEEPVLTIKGTHIGSVTVRLVAKCPLLYWIFILKLDVNASRTASKFLPSVSLKLNLHNWGRSRFPFTLHNAWGTVAATLSLASDNTWDAAAASPTGPMRWKDKGGERTGLQRVCLRHLRGHKETWRASVLRWGGPLN